MSICNSNGQRSWLKFCSSRWMATQYVSTGVSRLAYFSSQKKSYGVGDGTVRQGVAELL